MRFRGFYPSGAFVLFLIGAGLFLLGREIGPYWWDIEGVTPWNWVRITMAEAGPSFHAFQGDQVLGRLVERDFPRLTGRLSDRCRKIPLQAGTEIHLGGGEEIEERGCLVTPLPERCRYLMGMPLNVNRSGAEDLELLGGIGPRLAGRIVEVRRSTGPFCLPEDLLRVPGIGRKLVEKMQGRICFF